MLNIEDFLEPISPEQPCGSSLRYEPVYDQIKEYRREDDGDLSQGIWQAELKKANWAEVINICKKVLQEQSKDIQVAAWLTEALTVTHSISGLNEGLQLMLALCERFWDGLYPAIGKNDYTYRLSPFFFLIEKLHNRVVLLPITDTEDSTTISYTLADWITARHNIKIRNITGLSISDIKKSVLSSSLAFFQALLETIDSTLSTISLLDRLLTDKCHSEAPSFQALTGSLEDIRRITTQNIADKQKQLAQTKPKPPEPEPEQEEISDDTDNTATQASSATEEATIEQAYAALREIAVFLEEKQPQSPASILVKIASSIGTKTFKELLEINMQNGTSVMNTISELYRLLSKKPEPSAASSTKS